MKWEYRIIESPSEGQLDYYGMQGWELVAVIKASGGTTAYMKRPLT